MNICVFGSSSAGLDAKYLEAVEAMGRAFGERGHGLVFGGYDMGLMGAAARGFNAGGGRVFGVVTDGLSAKGDRVVFPCDEVVSMPDLAARKQLMMERADAFVTVPGGIGTMDELFDVLSQAKAGESTKPCAILDVDCFYTPLVQMLDEACAKGLNNTNWRAYCEVFTDAAALVAYLEAQLA